MSTCPPSSTGATAGSSRKIDAGLHALRQLLIDERIPSIAIPALGGVGGPPWRDVEPRIAAAQGDIPDIDIELYPSRRAQYSSRGDEQIPRLIIASSRSVTDYDVFLDAISWALGCTAPMRVQVVVVGGAHGRGYGARWARAYGIPVEVFPRARGRAGTRSGHSLHAWSFTLSLIGSHAGLLDVGSGFVFFRPKAYVPMSPASTQEYPMPHRHLYPHSKQPLASLSLSRLMRRSSSSPWLRGHKVCISVGIFAAMLSTACGDPEGGKGVDAAQLPSVTMFVTDTRQDANFGGIAGADALCAREAANAGLQGEYKAWLSTSSSSVASRLIQYDAPHILVDGTVVANNWQDLVDGSIDAPINLDATGTQRGGDVWTGTLATGNSSPGEDCGGFTSGGVETALCGNILSTGPAWTEGVTPPCSTTLRLYCIQQ